MLLLLWLFQTVFLDSFYKAINTQNIKSSAVSIAINIDNQNLSKLIEHIAQQNSTCVRVININASILTELYSADVTPNCFIHKMSLNAKYALY